eukprot:12231709-Alexandrium_andersonii.AAC.1
MMKRPASALSSSLQKRPAMADPAGSDPSSPAPGLQKKPAAGKGWLEAQIVPAETGDGEPKDK